MSQQDSFEELKLKSTYDSLTDDILTDFYYPIMKRAVSYHRFSAYFSLNALKLYSIGIQDIYRNNGNIRFVFSHEVDDSVYEAVRIGYIEKSKNNLKKDFISQVEAWREENLSDDYEIANLAFLISIGLVDVKIAYVFKNEKSIGLAHYKTGVFIDKYGNIVRFHGSLNESVQGFHRSGEDFDVSLSYDSENPNDIGRCKNSVKWFDDIWSGNNSQILILDHTDILKRRLAPFSKNRVFESEKDFFFGNALIDIIDTPEGKKIVLKDYTEKGFPSFSNIMIQRREYFSEFENNQNHVFKALLSEFSGQKFRELVKILESDKRFYNFIVTSRAKNWFTSLETDVEKRKKAGIKFKETSFDDKEYKTFKEEISKLLLPTHQLTESQNRAVFFSYNMKSSANYSVPGTGKTTMAYALYAYLKKKNKIDKMVVIGPLSSFMAWNDEFIKCFGLKPRIYNPKNNDISSPKDELISNNKSYEIFLINYDMTPSVEKILNKYILDNRTLLVYDEVHKIKNPSGVMANACLKFVNSTAYKLIMSGTPIPNSFVDLFNQCEILFAHGSPFHYSIDRLEAAKNNNQIANNIKDEYYPFFFRITKHDLNIPVSEPNDYETLRSDASEEEVKLLQLIREKYYDQMLPLIVRLIQAQSNPMLLLKKKVELFGFDSYEQDEGKPEIYYDKTTFSKSEIELIKSIDKTQKYRKTIEFVKELADKGNKVLVWCLFTDTIDSACDELNELGVSAISIYGKDKPSERESKIRSFKNNEDIKVLITNPNTLAESISLHDVCHHAVYLEYGYNLTYLLQSKDRIHRYGLKEGQKTHYYFSVLNCEVFGANSIDLKIIERLDLKEKRMLDVIENNYLEIEDDSSVFDDLEAIYKEMLK